MGFLVIKGKFFIMGYQPDGDSVKFSANDSKLFKKMRTDDGKPAEPKLNNKGYAQLRIEAIDALETHYTAGHVIHQPKPLADAARKKLLGLLGFTGVQFGESDKEVTGVNNDGMPGYILTKYIDNRRYGRPVSYVFAGKAPWGDGKDAFLTKQVLRNSVNYKMLYEGFAYPTFYKNLYFDLRNEFTSAVKSARQAHRGLWSEDKTNSGFNFNSIKSITDDNVIMPKLFRRLAEHINKNGGKLETFIKFLENKKDYVYVLNKFHKQVLSDLVKVSGKKVTLLEKPENIIFDPQ